MNRDETMKAAERAYEVARVLGWSAPFWNKLPDEYHEDWCQIIRAGQYKLPIAEVTEDEIREMAGLLGWTQTAVKIGIELFIARRNAPQPKVDVREQLDAALDEEGICLEFVRHKIRDRILAIPAIADALKEGR